MCICSLYITQFCHNLGETSSKMAYDSLIYRKGFPSSSLSTQTSGATKIIGVKSLTEIRYLYDNWLASWSSTGNPPWRKHLSAFVWIGLCKCFTPVLSVLMIENLQCKVRLSFIYLEETGYLTRVDFLVRVLWTLRVRANAIDIDTGKIQMGTLNIRR
jgi:hypothetical protein